jgi:hypothetical protein
MANTTPPSTSAGSTEGAAPERVYVKIPKAGPGQGYHAPKNFQRPLVDLAWRVLVVLMCLSLLVIPLAIIGMILFLPASGGHHNAYEEGFLWLWIPMFLFVEAIALFVAIGIGRAALGIAGSGPFER